VLGKPLPCVRAGPEPERLRDGRRNELGVRHGAQVDEHDAVPDDLQELPSEFQREPRLAAPTGAGQRQ
jgi:hypothetical protein